MPWRLFNSRTYGIVQFESVDSDRLARVAALATLRWLPPCDVKGCLLRLHTKQLEVHES